MCHDIGKLTLVKMCFSYKREKPLRRHQKGVRETAKRKLRFIYKKYQKTSLNYRKLENLIINLLIHQLSCQSTGSNCPLAKKREGKVVECSKTPNWDVPQVNRQQVTVS